MEYDDHLQSHLDLCEEHCQRLNAEGKWPWSDSPTPIVNGRMKRPCAKAKEYDLPEDTVAAIRKLVAVLRRLHHRLIADGYELVDGQYRRRSEQEYDKKSGQRHKND